MIPDLDRCAMSLAHLAYMETRGTPADQTEAAVWAYLWALENTRPFIGDLVAYPSLNDLRAALELARAEKT